MDFNCITNGYRLGGGQHTEFYFPLDIFLPLFDNNLKGKN